MRLFDNQRYGIWGFTGTRNGLTSHQGPVLSEMIIREDFSEFHHGDCIGADLAAHVQLWLWVAGEVEVNIHPPLIETYRAFATNHYPLTNCYTHPPKDYIARNHDIVNACNRLIAVPGEMFERKRSGTWATVRYARKIGRPITIIFPDGTVRNEKGKNYQAGP